jgi:hypothetical protein
MKIKPGFFLLFTLIMVSSYGQISQDFNAIEKRLEMLTIKETALPAEKIYLHLDRPNYMQGDTIWFKAYSWFGYDQVPDTVSLVVYVDLLNPHDSIEQRRKLLIRNGTSNSEFILDKEIAPGIYTLRASTRWMQNPGAGEPFYQRVNINPLNQFFFVECNPVIIKQSENDSLRISFRFYEMDAGGELRNYYNHPVKYSLKVGDKILRSGQVFASNAKEQIIRSVLPVTGETDSVAIFDLTIDQVKYEKQFRIPLLETIDLQFFPEGGSLVNGLESRLAFKAIGTDGLGREVEGDVKDAEGNTVVHFKSSHSGMGVFNIRPESGKNYFGQLEFNQRKYLYPLPVAKENGSVMSVTAKDLNIEIKSNPPEPGSLKYIVGSAYGMIRCTIIVRLSKDSSRVQIPLELFPEGVAKLTLLDSDFKPECERLIYVDKNQRFKIEIEPDSASYGNRSKVSLLIKTTGLEGFPVQTELSLAVVDKEQILETKGTRGISAYKLLESELRGYIEDADFYFRDDSCTNREALDLLLMTHGYRKFLPDETSPGQLKFQPERSFDISGKINLLGWQSRNEKYKYRDIGLTLLCPSDNPYFNLSSPDSLGNFSFSIPLLYGKNLSLLQALNPRGKPLYGEILLDATDTMPRFTPPIPQRAVITPPGIEFVSRLQAVKRTEVSKIASGIGMYLDLPEVTIKGRDKYYYLNFEEDALKIVDMDSLDPGGDKFENIYDLLIREFGGQRYYIPESGSMKTVFMPSKGMLIDYYYPIYLINGSTYFTAGEDSAMFFARLNNLSSLNVNEIKRLMVLPPGRISSWYADPKVRFYPLGIQQSLVVMETYSNNIFRGDPQGIRTFILDGLDTPRQFYSPQYEGSSGSGPVYDGRATFFWEPSIITDINGQARVEFYTGDQQTEMELNVSGIEVASGHPGQARKLINSTIRK